MPEASDDPGETATESEVARPEAGDWLRMWAPYRVTGRIGRRDLVVYLVAWHVVAVLVAVPIAGLIVILAGLLDSGAGDAIRLWVLALFGLGYLGGVATFGIRRLHDIGRSPAWMLLGLVPLVNVGLGLALVLVPGQAGVNAHGERARVPLFERDDEAARRERLEREEAFEAGRRAARQRSD
jgi:uncharacterized membrane protein YhaH (DUF805 family)